MNLVSSSMTKLSRKVGLSREVGDKARGRKLHIVLLYTDTHVEREHESNTVHTFQFEKKTNST